MKFKHLTIYALARNVFLKFLHNFNYYKITILGHKKINKINLGSGPYKSNNDLVNIDIFGSDLSLNLIGKLPFESNSLDLVYTSHFLEHLDYEELNKLLSECYRILRDGAKISICVPNAKLYLDSYASQTFFRDITIVNPGKVDTGSFIDQVNYIAYLGGDHKFMFDEENLINMLKKYKFRDCKIREFDASYDERARDFESIYAEAYK